LNSIMVSFDFDQTRRGTLKQAGAISQRLARAAQYHYHVSLQGQRLRFNLACVSAANTNDLDLILASQHRVEPCVKQWILRGKQDAFPGHLTPYHPAKSVVASVASRDLFVAGHLARDAML
jgi:hypothetical protein